MRVGLIGLGIGVSQKKYAGALEALVRRASKKGAQPPQITSLVEQVALIYIYHLLSFIIIYYYYFWNFFLYHSSAVIEMVCGHWSFCVINFVSLLISLSLALCISLCVLSVQLSVQQKSK